MELEIPESLKKDRDVHPYLARARELHTAQPVVSYFCKIYVLEHILSKQLHVGNPEVEAFTVALLDDTEAIKNSHEDENVRAVLESRQLSVNVVFAFAFRLFHSCLEEISHYEASRKILLASKLRAAINFFNVLQVFTGDQDTEIDFEKTTGGKCTSKEEFIAFVRDKLKTLKYQLSRLIKDEIPVVGEEEELRQLELDAQDEENENEQESKSPQTSAPDVPEDSALLSLPGVPRFDPSEEDDDLKLPGAPHFLPDDDVSHINKQSAIHMIPPQDLKESGSDRPKSIPAKSSESISKTAKSSKVATKLTKEDITSIIDSTEHISQIQKHAKFAISALNYEDLDTAEEELKKGLELLALVRQST